MQDHGPVSKVNQRLRDTECQRSQPCPKTSNKNQRLHLSSWVAIVPIHSKPMSKPHYGGKRKEKATHGILTY